MPVGLFLLETEGGFLAGSKIDWISQHTVLPDYFRNKFYETGNLFPQYAAELGGGQNIYNFAYYGLYHPLYLFSYLLPFVKMRTYLQGLMLLVWCTDGILMYRWLENHVKEKYAFFGAMQFIMSAPVIYHSSGQVMFVSYLPFLLVLLLCYERKQNLKRDTCMTLAVLGMILSSFYFAVGGLLAFGIYVISDKWSKQSESISERFKQVLRSCYPIIPGILLSAFYILPVIEAMKGRGEAEKIWNLKELLFPDFSVNKILYSAYGIGLTIIAMLAVCTFLLYKRSRERVLAGILFLCFGCPFVLLLLNGGLYIRAKVLIPMLPLYCLLTAEYLQKVEEKSLITKKFLGVLYLRQLY